MWNRIMDFFKKNKRRPSKYRPDERMLRNWVKYNIRRMRDGQMPAARQKRMQQLLAVGELLKRVNQYHYKHTGDVDAPTFAAKQH